MSETFAEVLKKAIKEQNSILMEYDEDEIIPMLERKAQRVQDNILYSFELYGDFLDIIPLPDKEQIIYNAILPWMNIYSSNHIPKKLNDMFPISREATKEIKKNIGIIKKFEDMLTDNFSSLEENIKLNDTLKISNDRQSIAILETIKTLLKTTESLKGDLYRKDFKIFPKHKYYAYDLEPKIGLTKILDKLIQDYGLKGHNPYKKQLIDNI